MQSYNVENIPASIYKSCKDYQSAYIMRGIIRFLYTPATFGDYDTIKILKKDPVLAAVFNNNSFRYNLLQMSLKFVLMHKYFVNAEFDELSKLAADMITRLQIGYRDFSKEKKEHFVNEVKSLVCVLLISLGGAK